MKNSSYNNNIILNQNEFEPHFSFLILKASTELQPLALKYYECYMSVLLQGSNS